MQLEKYQNKEQNDFLLIVQEIYNPNYFKIL